MAMSDLKKLIETRVPSHERYNHLVKEAYNNSHLDRGRTMALLALAEAMILSDRPASTGGS